MKYILPLSFLLLTTCAHAAFEVKKWYVVDLTNGVCAEYDIVDQVNIKFRLSRELPLQKGGPCDRVAGAHRNDVNKTLNYLRDAIKKCNN